MGKYNLGEATTSLRKDLKKDKIIINEAKAQKLINDIEKQLEIIRKSLANSNILLNQLVKAKVVTGVRAKAFKGWSNKCKSQANACDKAKKLLNEKYDNDMLKYPLQLLDEKIAALEKKIANLEKDEGEVL